MDALGAEEPHKNILVLIPLSINVTRGCSGGCGKKNIAISKKSRTFANVFKGYVSDESPCKSLKTKRLLGAWRSWLAHLHGVQGVESSSLFAPTKVKVSCFFQSCHCINSGNSVFITGQPRVIYAVPLSRGRIITLATK